MLTLTLIDEKNTPLFKMVCAYLKVKFLKLKRERVMWHHLSKLSKTLLTLSAYKWKKYASLKMVCAYLKVKFLKLKRERVMWHHYSKLSKTLWSYMVLPSNLSSLLMSEKKKQFFLKWHFWQSSIQCLLMP